MTASLHPRQRNDSSSRAARQAARSTGEGRMEGGRTSRHGEDLTSWEERQVEYLLQLREACHDLRRSLGEKRQRESDGSDVEKRISDVEVKEVRK